MISIYTKYKIQSAKYKIHNTSRDTGSVVDRVASVELCFEKRGVKKGYEAIDTKYKVQNTNYKTLDTRDKIQNKIHICLTELYFERRCQERI